MHDIPMLSSEGVYNMVVEVRNNCNLYEHEQEYLTIGVTIKGSPLDERKDGDRLEISS